MGGMKTYLQMDGDKLVELVEKREYDLLASERADFEVLVDKMEREFNAARKLCELLEDALIDISEYWDQDEREESMRGACWTALEIADAALKISGHLK
jgi:hypothetical protein